MITVRKQKFFVQQQKAGKGVAAQSMSSFNNIVKLEPTNLNLFSENELLRLIVRLVDLFAMLQSANVAHRNIKPANLVFSAD